MLSMWPTQRRTSRIVCALAVMLTLGVGGCGQSVSAPSVRWPGSDGRELTEFGMTFVVRDPSSPVSFGEILLCSDDGEAEITAVEFRHADGLQVARFATQLTGPEGGSNDPPTPGLYAFQEVDLERFGFPPNARTIESRCSDPEHRWTRLGLEVHTAGNGEHRGSEVVITYSNRDRRGTYHVPMTLVLCVGMRIPEDAVCE